MISAEKARRAKRITMVIDAVCRRTRLRADLLMGQQNPRDAQGTQARYAVWWVLYFRLGMTQAAIARLWRVSPQGIATGIRRVGELVEDSLVMCLAMEAAERAAAKATECSPLEAEAAERVARMRPEDWRGEKRSIPTARMAEAVTPGKGGQPSCASAPPFFQS